MDTLKTLRDEVLGYLDETGSTTTSTNANAALRQAHVQRCTEYDWAWMLWPRAETFSLASQQTLYTLHQEFDRPFYFKNRSNSEFLVDVPYRNVKGFAPDFTRATGVLREFAYWSRIPVQNQPAAPGVLTIVSSSGSDVGSTKGIIVRGDTPDGVTTEQINPNGTTPVVGLTSFTEILHVTKLSDWAGTMTMTADAGVTNVLKLFPTEVGREYQQIQLLWTPTGGGEIIEYRFFRRPNPLDRDRDVPDIPDPYKKILVWDALLIMAANDATIDSARKSIWEENQTRLERGLYAAYGNAQSIGGQSRSVRLLEDVDWA
jgi:hypothetical protein